MKDSQVYRKAAEMIASDPNYRRKGYPSCYAISAACRRAEGFEHLQAEYITLFKPGRDSEAFWGMGWSRDNPSIRNDCRTLALLLMAAIAESEGR